MSIKIIAKFVGTTTYLETPKKDKPDYENGQWYVLNIGINNGNNIEKQDGTSKCQYGSIRSFCENWHDIKQIKE